jgi:hypothetical protein
LGWPRGVEQVTSDHHKARFVVANKLSDASNGLHSFVLEKGALGRVLDSGKRFPELPVGGVDEGGLHVAISRVLLY